MVGRLEKIARIQSKVNGTISDLSTPYVLRRSSLVTCNRMPFSAL